MATSSLPTGFSPTLRDRSLPHQIDFAHRETDKGGLQVRVTCNCGWSSDRSIFNLQDAWALYRGHLYYPQEAS